MGWVGLHISLPRSVDSVNRGDLLTGWRRRGWLRSPVSDNLVCARHVALRFLEGCLLCLVGKEFSEHIDPFLGSVDFHRRGDAHPIGRRPSKLEDLLTWCQLGAGREFHLV